MNLKTAAVIHSMRSRRKIPGTREVKAVSGGRMQGAIMPRTCVTGFHHRPRTIRYRLTFATVCLGTLDIFDLQAAALLRRVEDWLRIICGKGSRADHRLPTFSQVG